MSEVELKQEAEEWIGDYTSVPCSCMFLKYDYTNLVDAYIASAELREKRIAELEAQIEQLTYLHNEDVNTIKLLNKQIKEIKEND